VRLLTRREQRLATNRGQGRNRHCPPLSPATVFHRSGPQSLLEMGGCLRKAERLASIGPGRSTLSTERNQVEAWSRG